MSDRKLYQVMRGLDEAEVREFETHLREDKRAAGKRLWKFYAALRKNVLLPDLPPQEVKAAENNVAELLAEKNENLDQAFRRWCGKLLEKLHNFLVQKEIDALPEEFLQLLLLRAYERRAMNLPFPGLYKSFARKIGKMPLGDLYYELKFRAGQVEIEIENPGGSRTKDSLRNMGSYYDNLDQKYLFHLARLNAYTLHFNQLYDATRALRHPQIMWQLARQLDRGHHPGIDIYLAFIELLMKDSSEEAIFRFEKKYLELYHRLEPTDRYLMYGYLVSKSQMLLNRGKAHIRGRVLEMQIFGVEQGLFFSGGKMDYKIYKSVVQTALMEGQIALIRRLMREYAEDKVWYDYEGQKEALHHLIEAKILMEEGEDEKAMAELNYLFQHFKLNDINMEIDFRTMKLQLHYLLAQWDTGLSALDALRMYVANNQVRLNKNLLRLMSWRQRWFRRLYRMGSTSPKRIPRYLEELEEDPEYRLKGWFRTQLQKLDSPLK